MIIGNCIVSAATVVLWFGFFFGEILSFEVPVGILSGLTAHGGK